MNNELKVAVCSRSFSSNTELRKLLSAEFKNVKYNETGKTLSDDELIDFLKDVDAAIVALETLNKSILDKLPKLKVIGKYGVGLNNLDIDAMSEKGIRLGWTGGVNKRSVSELVMGLMFDLLRNISFLNSEIRVSRWDQKTGIQLTNKKIGIIGLGHIGRDLINLLKPFDVEIYAHDVKDFSNDCQSLGINWCANIDNLLHISDIVTVHIPYKKETVNFIDMNKLNKMKQGSFLINTSRGGIVNENDLFQCLFSNHLAGAALDVFEIEPAKSNKLFELNNFIGTCHIGGSSKEAILKMGKSAIDGLIINHPAEFFRDQF